MRLSRAMTSSESGFLFAVRTGYIYYCLILKTFYEHMKITRIYDLPQKCYVSAWCFDFRSMLTYITSVPNGRENNLLIYFSVS